MTEAHLSFESSDEIPGYEIYSFRVALTGFLAASNAGQAVLYRTLCDWYTRGGRPDPEDLAQVRARPDGPHIIVTLKIRRGPEHLARAMLAGIYCDRTSEGFYIADEEPYLIPFDAFTGYGKQPAGASSTDARAGD